MRNIGSLSVQHPNNRTTFGWGSSIFITCSSDTKSERSFSLAFSLSVFTATTEGPVSFPGTCLERKTYYDIILSDGIFLFVCDRTTFIR